MAENLLQMSRRLRLYVPSLPPTLAEQFIRDRYRTILERKDWSGLRQESEFILDESKTDGTVLVTRKSDIVVGTDTNFELSDVGRQFKVGSSPVYTIVDVTVLSQTIELDRAFGGSTDTDAEYTIFDGYVSPPEDFLRFLEIIDLTNGWRLHKHITAEELNMWDPQRTNFGMPYCVIDRLFDLGNQPQYELWPYNTEDRTIYYTYQSRGSDLVLDVDEPIYPIRSDAIVAGALADAARWPGTKDDPNPYFARPDYWKTYEDEFEAKMIAIERVDEDLYLTWLKQISSYPFAPMSASFIQSHAI